MVKRTVKYSLGLLVLVMGMLLIVPFFIDVNNYKPQIAKAVEDATGRTVQIGEIEASLFPWIGVRLESVSLANRTGFSEREFLKVESLDVQLDLLPLLSKQIEIKRFTLDGPELFLERNSEGEGNWEDLTGSTSPATGGAAPGEKPVEKSSPALAAFSADSLQLNSGRFVWTDRVTGGHLELSSLQVDINNVQAEHPIELKASASLSGETITLNALIGPIGDISKLNIDRLPLQAELQSPALGLRSFTAWIPEFPKFLGAAADASLRLDLKLEQRPDGMRISTGELGLMAKVAVNAKWKAEMANSRRVQLKDFELSLNSQPLLKAQGELRLDNNPDYQLRVKSETIERRWLASLLPELDAMYAAHPAPWKELKIGALLAGTGNRLELRDVQLMPDGELIQLSGMAVFENAPDIRLRIASKELHADPWLPQAETVQTGVTNAVDAGSAEPEESQEPDLRAFKGWRISSQIQIEKMHLRGLELEHLRGSLNGSRGLFKLDPLRFDLSGGQVSESATLNVAKYPATWTESMHVAGVQIAPVLKALAGMDMLDGTLQMDTSLKATGLLPKNAMKRLGGKGSVLLRDGSVKGFDIAGTLRNFTTLGQQRGPKQTDFAQLSGGFTIRNGVVKNDDLFMASPLFRLTGQGVLNLPNGTMDYHVKPRLVGTLTGQGDTVTVRKGLSIPLRIKGPFASPRVIPEVDPASLIENIDAIRGGAGGNVLKGLEKVITGGGQEKSQPATQTPQQQPKKATPEQKMQKALEGLIQGL